MNSETAEQNLHLARQLVDNLLQLGVKQFVISPGSRSTPLTLAVAENKLASSVVHYDERGAAFFALGHARATGVPAVLICTSGTAVANYFPALIESSMDRIPLIVISADRPPELIDSGANQTIFQDNIFGKYVRYHCQLIPPYTDTRIKENIDSMHAAFHTLMGELPGPVHINCMFDEPLIPTKAEITSFRSSKTNSKIETKPEIQATSDKYNWQHLADKINSADTGLIVVARHQSEKDIVAIENLANHLGWTILPDITSGMRLGSTCSNNVVHYDYLIDKLSSSDNDPLTIIHFGAQPISKKLTRLLSNINHDTYIHVSPHLFKNEPYSTVSDRVDLQTSLFCQKIISLLNKKTEQVHLFDNSISKTIADLLNKELMVENLSEPAIARIISRQINTDSCLFVASSRPIRDLDQFAVSDGPKVELGCNRGASGIDGTIATAAGFGSAHQKALTIFIGDLALLHDLNSLPLLHELDLPVVIIVINNNGGGIFSFLNVNEHEEHFEKFFGTAHGFSFESAAKMFNCHYLSPTTQTDFVKNYKVAQQTNNVTIIEIKTNRNKNVEFHNQLRATILDEIKSKDLSK